MIGNNRAGFGLDFFLCTQLRYACVVQVSACVVEVSSGVRDVTIKHGGALLDSTPVKLKVKVKSRRRCSSTEFSFNGKHLLKALRAFREFQIFL